MDEWFVNLEGQGSQELRGVFRVPTDQVSKLDATPVEFLSSGRALEVQWQKAGLDEDGRIKLQVVANSSEPMTELTIRVPEGLLDDNQSLVGFITLGQEEPTTLWIPAGASESFSMGQRVAAPSVSSFFKLGLSHIIEGSDHILFLFCLLMAGGTLKHFFVVVTSFTVGHSITLAASVLGYVSLPSQVTEVIIALSIVVAALASRFWLKAGDSASTMASRGLLAGGFGLVHGLGFAGILREIGIEGAGVTNPLLGFNLGVEAGQLIIVFLICPLLWALRKWDKHVPFLVGCSYLAALLGLYWMVERLEIL